MAVATQLIASSSPRVVVGLGDTGLSCARFLHDKEQPFVMVDTRDNPPGLAQVREEMPNVVVYTGDYPHALIETAAELVASPGVAMDDPIVQCALAADVPVVGDIDLFVREAKAPVIGITGSNAKSTVTELVGQMAGGAGRNVGVGGNLGTPALALLSPERDLYVLELSSFQLERSAQLNLAVATVLNVSADHLDRHGSMPAYHSAKHRIFRGAQAVVVNLDDPLTTPLVAADVAQHSWRLGEPSLQGFGLRLERGVEHLCHGFDALLPTTELGLQGRHNIANALAALALGFAAGLPLDAMVQTLREFRGLPHRCEFVGERRGVRYIDDSKGTNVGATEAALRGLGAEKNIYLIAGGQGKGADFSALREAVTRHVKQVYLFGEDAALLEEALAECATLTRVTGLEEAVNLAAQSATRGDLVLLSPACASFDMYSGYVARGLAFRDAVQALGEVNA